MVRVKGSNYYQTLAKLPLWPVIGLICMVVVIVTSQIVVFYFRYIPALLAPAEQSLSPEILAFLSAGMHRIIVNLSVWVFVLVMVNVALIYVIGKIKRLCNEL
jgi:hypothetical protein